MPAGSGSRAMAPRVGGGCRHIAVGKCYGLASAAVFFLFFFCPSVGAVMVFFTCCVFAQGFTAHYAAAD